MKLTTDKRYVLYYNFISDIYGYDITYRVLANYTFWRKREPIMYSDSLEAIELTTRILNEKSRT